MTECTISNTKSDNPSHFRVPIQLSGRIRTTTSAAMIDSGATGLFLNSTYAHRHRMITRPLLQPIKLYNIDGSPNRAGSITHSIRLMTQVDRNAPQLLEFLITDLGNEDVILGLPWLRKVNPNIDWEKG